jgi:hypothetical protein
MSKIKSFRGKLADGTQERISLQTNNGLTGYRIKKLHIIPAEPGKYTQEITVQVFSTERSSVGATVDFSDQTLLGVAIYAQSADSYNSFTSVVFDSNVFNQDIYVTLQDTQNNDGGNYYIELEQMKLDLNEQTVATLKDIRNVGAE